MRIVAGVRQVLDGRSEIAAALEVHRQFRRNAGGEVAVSLE
jgi:hypothetical protein